MRLKEDSPKLISILVEHKVLNTCEVCRVLNGYHKRNVDVCYKGQGYAVTRQGPNWTKGRHCRAENCVFLYHNVWSLLRRMERKEMCFSVKMLFYDSWGGQKDIFRFWFVDHADFEEKIMRQTLIPYVR